MAQPVNSTDQDGKNTPNWWNEYEDSRKKQGAMKYPNVAVHETPSGHTIIMDDSPGNESMTIQHRGGAMLQFKPDGAIHVKSHNGMQEIVMGEKRVKITGAYDVTVEGGGSMRVKGDFNQTIEGNHNMTVHGDVNTVAKNMNTVVAGNMDTVAKNQTTKIEGNAQLKTSKGSISMSAQAGVALASEGDSVTMFSKSDIGLHAQGGDLAIKTGGKTAIKSAQIDLNSPGARDAETVSLTAPPTVS